MNPGGCPLILARALFAIPVLAVALLLCSCNGGAEETNASVLSRLHGDWVMDLDATIAADPNLRENTAASDAERNLARTMLGELAFNIDVKNSTISGSMIGSSLPLREFEILAIQGDEVQIVTEGSVLRLVVKDAGMRIHAANGDTLIFRRR